MRFVRVRSLSGLKGRASLQGRVSTGLKPLLYSEVLRCYLRACTILSPPLVSGSFPATLLWGGGFYSECWMGFCFRLV